MQPFKEKLESIKEKAEPIKEKIHYIKEKTEPIKEKTEIAKEKTEIIKEKTEVIKEKQEVIKEKIEPIIEKPKGGFGNKLDFFNNMNKTSIKKMEKIEQTHCKTNELDVSEMMPDRTKSLVSKYNSSFQPKREEIKKEVAKFKPKNEEILQNPILIKQPIEDSASKNIKNEEIPQNPFKNPLKTTTIGERAQIFISKPQEKVFIKPLAPTNSNSFKEKLEGFNKTNEIKETTALSPPIETKVSVKEMSKNLSMMNLHFGNYPGAGKPKPVIIPEEKTVESENCNEKKQKAPLTDDDYNNVIFFCFSFVF